MVPSVSRVLGLSWKTQRLGAGETSESLAETAGSPSRVAPFYGPRALGVLTVRKPDFPRASDPRETLAGIEVPFKIWPWNSCTIASIIFHSLEVSQ